MSEAVCAALATSYPVPVELVGVNDVFGQVGTQDYLMQVYNLTANDIVGKAKKCIERKPK